jgi:hypothetical protein
MNKKKLALTLLLSSVSASVVASTPPSAVTYDQIALDAAVAKAKIDATAEALKGKVDQAALDAANKALADLQAKAATDVKTAADNLAKVMADSTKTQGERDAAKSELAAAEARLTAAGLKDAGYFASAWAAVKSNQVMTAALVTTAVLVGAIVHAAVSNNNCVDADDVE